MISALPTIPKRARLPDRVSASAAGQLLTGQCRLRLLASRTFPPDARRLPPSIWSMRGDLIHDVIDAVSKNAFMNGKGEWARVQWQGTAEATARHAFALVVAAREAMWRITPERAHWVPLDGLFERLEWKELRREAISRARKYAANREPIIPVRTMRGGAAAAWIPLLPGETRTEAWVRGDKWKLQGKLDHVQLSDRGHLIVRDHKTGAILEEGTDAIKSAYVAQLRAYALMAREVQGLEDADVELWVDGPNECSRSVGGTSAELAAFAAALEEGTRQLELGLEANLESLAAPGHASCAHCGLRHACPSYRAWAPAGWLTDEAEGKWPFPLDVWGRVAKVVSEGEFHRIQLICPDQVVRQVSRVRSTWFAEPPSVDSELFFFGLATSDGPSRGVYRHPKTFNEWDAAPTRRAWSLSVFTGQ
ncbi:PD-(D/E)XK nuclease family protein [Anaeromyxobacter oryzae]|uniref:PD-(D/E)XK endonuclease-like domain-containing protein n=1 Tax=Anaeromyxobacter oryzae TaxID=2918170 RepID=A0ABN6MP92_9BACT|nr:PD-(D/E)XK nuclease family protein [Anaeromyxobacter oryzae]BDG02831.1 hypothetical protein AMOR_18270 [Anaeromyxobacter oryzae]